MSLKSQHIYLNLLSSNPFFLQLISNDLFHFIKFQITGKVWGPPGGRRWQSLGSLGSQSDTEDEEAMDVDDDRRADEEKDTKTSFEEQVNSVFIN